jgi:hypothetical protein
MQEKELVCQTIQHRKKFSTKLLMQAMFRMSVLTAILCWCWWQLSASLKKAANSYDWPGRNNQSARWHTHNNFVLFKTVFNAVTSPSRSDMLHSSGVKICLHKHFTYSCYRIWVTGRPLCMDTITTVRNYWINLRDINTRGVARVRRMVWRPRAVETKGAANGR